MKVDFKVDSYVFNESMIANIDLMQESNFNEGLTYIFFVIKDGLVLDRVYQKESQLIYPLKDSGVYLIQAYIKNKHDTSDFKRSLPSTFFTKEYMREIDCLVNESKNDFFKSELVFKKQLDPFFDFGIITCSKDSSYSKKIDNMNYDLLNNTGLSSSLVVQDSYNDVFLISEMEKKSDNHGINIFSGITKYDGQLITPNKLPSLDKEKFFRNLPGSTGCFSYISGSKAEFRVASDYFGFNRIFYYSCKDFFVASNRYHLLILILKSLNVKLKINYEKAWAGMWSFSHQIAMQNFSRKMDIQDIYQLENDKDLVYKNSGWDFVSNEFGQVLKSNEQVDFYAFLNKAKNEIVGDVELILQSPSFKHVTIDLSGGLDSRLVYAAATNLDGFKNKIKINSKDNPGSEDLDVAIKINNIYKYDFDSVSCQKEWLSPVESDQLMRSFYLGTYFSHQIYQVREFRSNHISLNGACGEIVARPYIARNLFGTLCDYEINIDGFVESMVSHLGVDSPVNASLSLNYFKKMLAEELKLIPSQTPYESIDRMYLMYRHGYHFDGGISYAHNGLAWMPLQSKSLFHLHHSVYKELKGLEIQGSLIYLTNPLLGVLKYDDQRDNKDIEKITDNFKNIDSRFCDLDIQLDNDKSSWESAVHAKKLAVSYVNSQPDAWNSISEKMYFSLFGAVRDIQEVDNVLMSDELKYSILSYAIKNKNNRARIRYMYNKLSSLRDQAFLAYG